MEISPEILKLIDEIKNNRTHGASELARQAASVLKIAAERSRAKSAQKFLAEQRAVGQKLMSVRPAMAPLYNMVGGLLDIISINAKEMDLNSLKNLTIAKADELIQSSLQAVARIAEHSTELFARGDRVMTHSYSSTVVAALKKAFNKHKDIEVVVTRSGTGRTGERLALELALGGVPVVFIDDTAVGLFIADVNKVVVGADRICADGKLVNGIGTYLVALAAQKAGVPFYVLCESLKFDPRLKGGEADLEEKDPSEVSGSLPSGVKVRHPYFDITPPELIDGIVTENGLLKPDEVVSYMRKLLP